LLIAVPNLKLALSSVCVLVRAVSGIDIDSSISYGKSLNSSGISPEANFIVVFSAVKELKPSSSLMFAGIGSVNYGKIFPKLWYAPPIIIKFYLIMLFLKEFLGNIPIIASLNILSGSFSRMCLNVYSLSPPG
jgi:hypothetical protein